METGLAYKQYKMLIGNFATNLKVRKMIRLIVLFIVPLILAQLADLAISFVETGYGLSPADAVLTGLFAISLGYGALRVRSKYL